MRAFLIDWLIKVQYKMELSFQTLYLIINIVDKFLTFKTILEENCGDKKFLLELLLNIKHVPFNLEAIMCSSE
ncbi:putative cyclin [Helianthus anomalus]